MIPFGMDGMIHFLDVLIMRKSNTIETIVYHKQTHNDIYLQWESFTPEAWKRGVLKTLLFREPIQLAQIKSCWRKK